MGTKGSTDQSRQAYNLNCFKKAIHHIVSQNMYDLIPIITPSNISFIFILIQQEYHDYKYFTV